MSRPDRDPILWRCRRGLKELDLLLERFARAHYRTAAPAQRCAFERLLELPDPVLVELIFGPGARAPGCDPQLAEIVALVVAAGQR